jgi:hypothetical protein
MSVRVHRDGAIVWGGSNKATGMQPQDARRFAIELLQAADKSEQMRQTEEGSDVTAETKLKYARKALESIVKDFKRADAKPGRASWKLVAQGMASTAQITLDEEDIWMVERNEKQKQHDDA